MSRPFSRNVLAARRMVFALLVAFPLTVSGCAKSTSGNQSNTNASGATTAAVATNDLMAKLPVYPGATQAVSNSGVISGKQTTISNYTTPDSFDKVYAWYQNALPAHSETAHQTTQMQESANFTMSGGTKQQTVSIVKTGGVEVTNIVLTDSGE